MLQPPEDFGRRVRAARVMAGLTRDELAYRLNVGGGRISELEQGRLGVRALTNFWLRLEAISVATDLPPAFFYGDFEHMEPASMERRLARLEHAVLGGPLVPGEVG